MVIDSLRHLAIFATVAEHGSFSAAGRELRLATSGISQHVSKLENRLGVTLFYRSTRSMSLTSDGRRLLVHAQKMIAAAEEGLDSIATSTEPAGSLSITMPAFMAGSTHESRIWDFGRSHPKVEITLNQVDSLVDIIGDGFDLGLRLGELSDSSLRARRIGSFGRTLVAAPEYLAGIDPIRDVLDLKRCSFVSMRALTNRLLFTRGDRAIEFQATKGRILVDTFGALRSAVIGGLGVQRLPATVVQEDLATGKLIEVLPGWALPELGIYAVWPDSGRHSSLARLLVDALSRVS